jgi:hypothetical protein
MENLNYFVSSRGILNSCSIRNNVPISSSDHIDENFLDGLKANSTIYVCTAALNKFILDFLPRIDKPFTLVTGDSDEHINDEFLRNELVAVLLKSDLLINWFAQNLVAHHPKLSYLPAGMDYHTMYERPGIWGMVKQSPIAQERALINIFSNSKPFENRYFVGYCNWHFQIERGDRKICKEEINTGIAYYEKELVPRYTTWLRQAECMFVVSPEAAGMDAHRTWEALLLGCVPVLKKSEFTRIFEGLPVLLIDEWSEFNPEYMIQYVDIFKKSKFNFSKLFINYWIRLINKEKSLDLALMTLAEFRDFIFLNSY